ncbi:DUF3551 domain-containing protein [Bradyrhizobium genosp. L]|uniref:DUF3551 domain-containing protein n=1 Tax=Bradyrhizobium genosp. L TaxID=83637 RepID=UPI0018A2F7D7|nr:DUF3551 domain-containing protein [Bradyrhizobium genosp. L]QPF83817.1 DUF3551 domain-containing protein [Bradyrhizobium genosp. L]
MKKILTIALFALATSGGLAVSSGSASARDYPWCSQGRQEGYPGDCNYQTRAQCMASVSGRDAACGINPRFAYGQQRQRPYNRY